MLRETRQTSGPLHSGRATGPIESAIRPRTPVLAVRRSRARAVRGPAGRDPRQGPPGPATTPGLPRTARFEGNPRSDRPRTARSRPERAGGGSPRVRIGGRRGILPARTGLCFPAPRGPVLTLPDLTLSGRWAVPGRSGRVSTARDARARGHGLAGRDGPRWTSTRPTPRVGFRLSGSRGV